MRKLHQRSTILMPSVTSSPLQVCVLLPRMIIVSAMFGPIDPGSCTHLTRVPRGPIDLYRYDMSFCLIITTLDYREQKISNGEERREVGNYTTFFCKLAKALQTDNKARFSFGNGFRRKTLNWNWPSKYLHVKVLIIDSKNLYVTLFLFRILCL